MQQKTKDGSSASRVTWETLESFARGSIQSFVQRLLEEEVTDLLGRRRSARKAPVDPEEGYRKDSGSRDSWRSWAARSRCAGLV